MKKQSSAVTAFLIFCAALLAVPALVVADNFFEKLFKQPEIKVKNVLLKRISTSDASFVTVLAIDNPTPLRAKLAGVDYDFELSGQRLTRGETGSGVDVRPYDEALFEIPVEVNYEDLKKVYDNSEGKDYLPYRIEGEVRVKSPWGEIPIPYKAKGKLPVVRPPRVRQVKANLKSLTFEKATVELKIDLENPNVFDLKIPRLQYDLDVKEKNFASGIMKDQSVAKKSDGELVVPVDFDPRSAPEWIRDVIQGGTTSYSLQYDATYNIKGHDVRQKETVSGSLKF